jgi:hypothetical protein
MRGIIILLLDFKQALLYLFDSANTINTLSIESNVFMGVLLVLAAYSDRPKYNPLLILFI